MEHFPPPVLQTSRLILREIFEGDWPEIHYLRSDDTVNAFVKRKRTTGPADAIDFIKKTEERIDNEKLAIWGITFPENNKVVGTICLWNFSEDRKTAEMGYDLAAAEHGNGYMTEAMKAVLEFGFVELRLDLIEAYTQHNNAASVHLLKKQGFALNAAKKDEGNLDNVIYELSFSDYSPKV